MVALERVLEQLRAGYEARGFEVKGPGTIDDKHLLAKVARTGLSLGNLRDGGLAVIGIGDDQLDAMTPGLTPEQLAGWTDFDRLSAALAVYADPPLSFDTQAMELPNGATVAVIKVAEFPDVPHLCARGFDGESSSKQVLRRGALYVRTHGKPETAEVATAEQMREVLEIATEKRLAAYVATAHRAGVSLTPGDDASTPNAIDEARYRTQREAGWS